MSSDRFDRKAREWDKKAMRRELAAAVSAAIAGLGLDPTMRIMDFGCGTGLVSLPLAEKVGHILALDSSAGMIEVIEDKLTNQRIGNVEARCADIVTADLPTDFDLILTSMTLHHIEDIDPILAGFHRLLKKGGRVAIADLDAEDGSFHRHDSGEKHHGFDHQELRRRLQSIGFEAIDVETVHTITKTMTDGQEKKFGIFLATATKP